ncbi:4-coumarate--CoA ligase-like 6 [Platanthera guangdongensis]|uniref:4-coumarate--CoA ligase n=1 Tax=Platanthera guangdongensis TaxID=2320717 RepID=A0ABR2LMR4_9ASPA
MEGAVSGRISIPISHPNWFSPETGIYSSRHSLRSLPQDAFLDLVTFLFSRPHRGEIALVDSASGLSISYPDLRSMVERVASGLRDIGVFPGQAVLILLPNSVLLPVILLGVLSLGAVITTMNPLSNIKEIQKQMECLRLALVFSSSEKLASLGRFGVPTVAVPSNFSYDSAQYPVFHKIVSGNPRIDWKPAIRQSDTAAILFSSGTSGSSKGVMLSHGNLISMVELFVRFEASQYKKHSWEDVYLAAIPMFHVYGLSLFSIGLLSLGSTVVVMRRFDAQEAAKTIARYRVTHFPVVPPIMAALIRAKDAHGCDLRSLKQASSGAAPLSKQLIHEFLRTFPHVDFIQGYGMTESTAVGTRGFNTETCKKYTSVGLLAPNMEAKVVNWETGISMPPGKSGELWLRGPAIMKGYLNDEKESESIIDKDGWFKTGDIVNFDQDGYLFILDRLKDTIKYKGFQIAPADLEFLLISHNEILDAAVTSACDEEAGEVPVAFVVRKPGSNLSSAEIMEFVAKQVAPYKRIRRVIFVQSIPKSPAGKTLRRVLRSSFCPSRM